MQAGPSDKEIITKVLQGDQRSFEVLVTRYQSFVFTIALRYTKNREDAEEVAQNAFVKAYRCLNDYRGVHHCHFLVLNVLTKKETECSFDRSGRSV
jgi:DNA-directed RNA polymerase specialized sigma24 family protein